MATKIPNWMSSVPHYLAHPGSTLKRAAQVIRVDAKGYRRNGDEDGERAAMRIARALDDVAAGKSWAEAFEFPTTTAPITGASKE